MISASELVQKIKSYNSKVDEAFIKKAYAFSKNSHGSQSRHSGEPYFSHPLAVAEILTELKLDEESIATALLHDVVEDTEVTVAEIEDNFGEDVAKLVDGVTKLGKIESIPSSEAVAENFRKLTLAMSEDIRVLLVKLADRLHNMRTLFYVPSRDKKVKKARECLDIYAPLAGRIGLNNVKDELQELAFEIIDPESRRYITERLDEIREKNKNLTEKIIHDLSDLLDKEDIECDISGREKRPYSIWTKMKKQNVGFHNLHDIMAFRMVVSNISECYRILGIINSNYSMIPGTFKDYISTPKENGYQSLHLAILGPFNKKIEIQIRDIRMHEYAENGVAAHWYYKEKYSKKSKSGSTKPNTESEKYRWIRDLISLFEHSETASEVLKNQKLHMHKDEVFCFTPNGDIFNLPFGATIVDFAYAIHSEVGNACVSAKVNGVISPLRKKIENGDQIEIMTSNKGKPSPNWLQFVTTAKARSTIKSFIRSEKSNEYKTLGKAILNKYFTSKKLDINDKILEKTLTVLNRKTVDDVYIKVAEGLLPRHDILKAAYPDFIEEENKKAKSEKVISEKTKHSNYSLPIEGLVSGMAMHYAGCCNPIPGDPILGVINTGTGVTIHSQNCRNLKNMVLVPQRVLDVCWKGEDQIGDELYSSRINILIYNVSGSLADISSIIAKKEVNITDIKTISRSPEYLELIVDVEVKNIDHLEEILSALRISRKIVEVNRASG